MSLLNSFLDALAFLSRLATPKLWNKGLAAERMVSALPAYGLVGLVLGIVQSLAALVFCLAFFTASSAGFALLWPQAMLGAWNWLGLSVWLTRALHWDGLADLGDALGSGASGARFWEILRDSRLGAFGALWLLIVALGQWLALSWHLALVLAPFVQAKASGQAELALAHFSALMLAPAWGRAGVIWLASSGTARDAQSLGGMLVSSLATVYPRLNLIYMLLAALSLLGLWLLGLSFWRLLLLGGFQFWLTCYLARIARDNGGLSGDFFGAAIESGTLLFLLLTI